MKQQAPKTLPQKAETIENTRKTVDILIGAACQKRKTTHQVVFLFWWSAVCIADCVACGRELNVQGTPDGVLAHILPFRKHLSHR